MSGIEAVHVHIASAAVPLGQPPAASPELVAVPHTVAVTADEPARQLCQPSPGRKFIGICAFTNAVVISRSKGDAQAPGNLASSVTQPNGAMIPSGVYVWFEATNELWVSTGTYPTLVSVIEVNERA
jgi:hypothetical protein